MSYDMTILRKGAVRYGITLTEKQEEQFIRYYELLIEWNKVMNLIAVFWMLICGTQVACVLTTFYNSIACTSSLKMQKPETISIITLKS